MKQDAYSCLSGSTNSATIDKFHSSLAGTMPIIRVALLFLLLFFTGFSRFFWNRMSPFGRLAVPNAIDNGQFYKKYCMRRNGLIPAILTAGRPVQSSLPCRNPGICRHEARLGFPNRLVVSIACWLSSYRTDKKIKQNRS
jgi:hypothetical protein